jgi:hypothetical protein
VVCAIGFWVGWDAYFHVEVRRQTAITETNNLRGYLSTDDFSYLTNKPIFAYPSAERLPGLLDDLAIRSILPPGLSSDGARDSVIESVKAALLQLSYFLSV